jgi:hypothetical protein
MTMRTTTAIVTLFGNPAHAAETAELKGDH